MKQLKIKEKLFKDKIAKHIKNPLNQPPYNPYNNIYSSNSKMTTIADSKNSTNKLLEKFNHVDHHRMRSDDQSYLNSNNNQDYYTETSRNQNSIFPYHLSNNL